MITNNLSLQKMTVCHHLNFMLPFKKDSPKMDSEPPQLRMRELHQAL